MKMPKTKKKFEDYLIYAFNQGLNCGYGVEHANITEDENKFRLEFAKMSKFSKATIKELENQHGK